MTPVIDVHAHIFRGKDIPLRGYLQSRWYSEAYIRFLGPIVFPLIAACIRRGRAKKGGILCGWVLQQAINVMGQGYHRWADVLSITDVARLTMELVNDHDGIDLYVPLLLDYEYWFRNTRETPIAAQIDAVYRHVVLPGKGKFHPFVPFDPARELAYRERLPGPASLDDGPPEEYSSLELVRDAIRNKGFIGVKVYNTLGYRPLGNAEVDDKRRSIFQRNGVPRYSVFTGAQFDQVLRELYDFCVQEQVPITAHCLADGIEAYPGASFHFGHPSFWKPVLKEFPTLHLNLAHFGWSRPEEYKGTQPFVQTLRSWGMRLIERAVAARAKAAGELGSELGRNLSREVGREVGRKAGLELGKKPWVREICDMLNTKAYEYLFVDVAHHGVTVVEDIPKYRDAYVAMYKELDGLLQQRLLFGIDWHVITRADNYRRFKERYTEVLKSESGGPFDDQEMAAFWGGNALRFLGLLPLGSAKGWTNNRKRLQTFYQNNEIDPPAWFTSTA